MNLPTDPAHNRLSVPAEQGQTGAGGRPRLTLSEAAAACAVSRSTLRRRLAQGTFPNAAHDEAGAWMVPVGDLLAAGPRVHAPRVAVEQGQPAVSMPTASAHRPPAGAGEQALAVERERREGAERLAAERAARVDDLRVSLRMLEAARPTAREPTADGQPQPLGPAAGGRHRRRWWQR